MKFVRLKNRSNQKTEKLKSILNNLNLRNIFNPCYKELNKNQYISFRANSESSSIESFILILDEDYKIISFTNLSKFYSKNYGINKINDPKLSILNKLLYLTFNTGFNIQGNDIYLAEINKDLPKPRKCIYEERMLIEKNWAFYNFNNKLLALYSLNPLVILESYFIESDEIKFKIYYKQKNLNVFFKGLTIGSNIEKIKNEYYLMAHEKRFLYNKRIYFGRLVCLSVIDKKFKITKIYPYRYIHSFRSLFGNIKKRNKNLFSCSYFSGISKDIDSQIILSYGINDFSFSFGIISF